RIIHNTGGGQTKCLKYIPSGLRVIKDQLFEPPFIFEWIREAVGTDPREMYQVFNMGNRLDIFTDRETAQSLIHIAQSYQIDAQIIGRVEAAEQKSLIVQSALGEFEYR
ncbi:MAG TPA: phosphoribosylformylglycinamidine cyclo-ligase, partial [Chitinophagaceae bacterium]|nr:phosphoribosylformylglycinamidine cyclo-ligase [Chitinophagaceae bacterium]